MTFEKDIAGLYPKLRQYAIAIARDRVRGEDLLHETLACVATAKGITNLPAYCKRAIWLSWASKRSSFRRTYSAVHTELTTDIPEDTDPPPRDLPENILHILRGFDRELYEIYIMPGFDYSTVAALTGLDKSELKNNISQSTKKLRAYVRAAQSQG